MPDDEQNQEAAEDNSWMDEVLNEAEQDNQESANGEGGEEQPTEETAPEPEQAAPEAKPTDEDEELPQGQAIPYAAFQKKNAKWKARHAELEKTWGDKYSTLEKQFKELQGKQPTAEVQQQLTQLQQIFGNLDRAAQENPWLAETLLALGRGENADWQKLSNALTEQLKAQPRDPVMARELAQIRQAQEEFRTDRLRSNIEVHVQRENAELEKMLGGDKEAISMINELAMRMAPQQGDVKDLPNRVELAKNFLNVIDRRTQAALKARVPAKPAGAVKPIKSAAEPKAGTEQPAPPMKTAAWYKWIAGQTYTEDDLE